MSVMSKICLICLYLRNLIKILVIGMYLIVKIWKVCFYLILNLNKILSKWGDEKIQNILALNILNDNIHTDSMFTKIKNYFKGLLA